MRASRSPCTIAYRNTSSGGRTTGTFNVYGYSLPSSSTKTVASITLPDNTNVDVLAISTVASVAAPTSLTVAASIEQRGRVVVDRRGRHRHRLQRLSRHVGGRRIDDADQQLRPCRPAPPATPMPPPWGATPIITSSRRSTVSRSAPLRTRPAWQCPPAGSTIPVESGRPLQRGGHHHQRHEFLRRLGRQGKCVSETEVGTSVTWNGIAFPLGAPTSTMPSKGSRSPYRRAIMPPCHFWTSLPTATN